jgi:hypothetical protein
MRSDGADRTGQPDAELWRRSVSTELVEDGVARALDLAGFAEGRLDPDDLERIAAWLAVDGEAAGDVAAARSAAATEAFPAPPEAVVRRACALVQGAGVADNIIAFPARRHWARLRGATHWGSLAAAVAVAAWLGFTLGIDTSRAFALNERPASTGFLSDLLDAQTGAVSDLAEVPQT